MKRIFVFETINKTGEQALLKDWVHALPSVANLLLPTISNSRE